MRAYYSNNIEGFLLDNESKIIGDLTLNHNHSLDDLQRNAWRDQIRMLKSELGELQDLQIYFEFAIPRMGKRVDNIVLYGGRIYVVEYKVGTPTFDQHAIDQVMDYALDLSCFHETSHEAEIIPVLIASGAEKQVISIQEGLGNVYQATCIGQDQLAELLNYLPKLNPLDPNKWGQGLYKPTPTIIEAAQAMFQGHNVEDISRSDGGAINLSRTTTCIGDIITKTKNKNEKAICFVTGVPGAGKTLAGLKIAIDREKIDKDEHAVFLSGNGPLVTVLREALARDKVEQGKARGERISKKDASREANSFVQNIHHFRDDSLRTDQAPIEKVVVFDEAQRAWTKEKASAFMKQNKGVVDFDMSEPEFLISILDRHEDWSVIVCLIGGGQEINTGEAGLEEWIDALSRSFNDWNVYYSDLITENQNYLRSEVMKGWVKAEGKPNHDLHLGVSVRSFRSEQLSHFIGCLLEVDEEKAREIYVKDVSKNYPIVLTRNQEVARDWLRDQSKGTRRCGLVASSGGIRLRPLGLNVKAKIDAANWFLNDKRDIRSSFYLEEVATEFDVQGLELDWVGVCWDADLRFDNERRTWIHKKFSGTKWRDVKQEVAQRYLINAYRVLLTRGRQGMVIFIPEGDDRDYTRKTSFYDGTFNYLKSLGIKEI